MSNVSTLRRRRVALCAGRGAAAAEFRSASRAACCGGSAGFAAATAELDDPQPDEVDGQQRGDGREQPARLQIDRGTLIGGTNDRAYAAEPKPAGQR